MKVYFVPRQKEDPVCSLIGMYYSEELDRFSLCDIEDVLSKDEEVTIVPAPQKIINALVAAFFPQPFIGITDDNEDYTA